MIEVKDSEEIYFKEIMSDSKLEMPFPDFEDNVMLHIHKSISSQTGFSKELRLSWIFFLLGSVFGITISLILPHMQGQILGFDPQKVAIIFQIIFVVLLFTQMDTLLRLAKGRS